MGPLFSLLQLLSVALAGWIHRYQQAIIDPPDFDIRRERAPKQEHRRKNYDRAR